MAAVWYNTADSDQLETRWAALRPSTKGETEAVSVTGGRWADWTLDASCLPR